VITENSKIMFAKKSLGQNFLKSKQVIEKLVKAGAVQKGDTVFEIGPGRGALTEALLLTEAFIIAVEADETLVEYLKEKFSTEIGKKQLLIIHGDALTLDLEKYIQGSYKIVSNIPYYITGAVLKKFLSLSMHPTDMALLVQREVADRIVARDGKESILSISVSVYGKPKVMAKVGASAFTPSPKVDSAIIAISNISKDFFSNYKISESDFFTVVKAGFAHKRKQLAKNLKSILDIDFPICNLSAQVRAEELTLVNWACLTKLYAEGK